MPGSLVTFQDFEKAKDKAAWVASAIEAHKCGGMYKEAVIADSYYRWENKTLSEFVQTLYDLTGQKFVDTTSSNMKLPSRFFYRLNTQRCMYSLGNGAGFSKDATLKQLGEGFNSKLQAWGTFALIHGLAFAVWDVDHIDVRKVTEMVPVWDEYDGSLRAAIYFCRIGPEYPMSAMLYEEDGFTKYREGEGGFEEIEPKRGYKVTISKVPATGLVTEVLEENYTSLPVVPMWGSEFKRSTLVGMRGHIDAYDLIKAGFANDTNDCAQIYWIVKNAGGMQTKDLLKMRDQLKLLHIFNANTDDAGDVQPYTQDVPFGAREALLTRIRQDLYDDFGALDVHTLQAGNTNDHIDAAYQPLDEEADKFETQVADALRALLAVAGIDDEPKFTRNRVSNVKEQVEIVLSEAEYFDDETILEKLPNVTADEVKEILRRKDAEAADKMAMLPPALQQNAQQPGDGEQEPEE